jgi:L-amino acid N-acyltransferase YncA
MPALLVRAAMPADAPEIAAIYNEGIADRVATFETRERTVDDVRAWLDDGLPFLVATVNGGLVGWARVAPYSDRCVYSGVGEHGVYVARAARGHRVGRRLLDELCAAAEAAGLYKLTSRIFADNASSIAAHEAAGFEVVGVQRRHGRLDGRWKDCVLVERLLGDAAAAPEDSGVASQQA